MTGTRLIKKAFILATLCLCMTTLAHDARAQDDWTSGFMIRGRGIVVMPDEDSTIRPIGGHVDISTSVMPELDISYFFTDNLALELILATTPHSAKAKDTAVGNVDVGDFWILPPTLLAQFHLPLNETFKPYVGAGVNYTLTYGEDDDSGGPVTSFKLDNGVGFALQAGIDIFLDEHWALNFDVKHVWLNLDAKLNGGAIRADIDVDPWIFGAGVGYRF